MKVAINLISSIFTGLMTAYSNIGPAAELHHLWLNRRRVVGAVLLIAAGFVFIMSALILGTIESALQYEAQGFILWNAVLSVATGFFIVGGLSFLSAKFTFPKAKPAFALAGLFEGLDIDGILASVDQVRRAMESPQTPAPAPPVAAEQAEQRREARQAREEIRDRPHGDFSIDAVGPNLNLRTSETTH